VAHYICVFDQLPLAKHQRPPHDRLINGAKCVKNGKNTPYHVNGRPILHSLDLYPQKDLQKLLKIWTPVLCKMRYDEDIFPTYDMENRITLNCDKVKEVDKMPVFSQEYVQYESDIRH